MGLIISFFCVLKIFPFCDDPTSTSIAPSSIDPTSLEIPPITFGVYYYPWHRDDFHGGGYLRELLDPPQKPTLGEYDDRDDEVISQHLQWSAEARISLWMASWWGPHFRTDQTLLENILVHPKLQDFPTEGSSSLRIAIHYETVGRTQNFETLKNIADDMRYLREYYFEHPRYYRIEDRPVLFVYLTRGLATRGLLVEAVTLMREVVPDLYVVGDHLFSQAPNAVNADVDKLRQLDAVTSYDVYGGLKGISGGSFVGNGLADQAKVDEYFQTVQRSWRDLAAENNSGIRFFPSITPGYNDRGVRLDANNPPLSRELNPPTSNIDHGSGSLFRAMLNHAKELVDQSPDRMILITSFNEWHEDTQIEPIQAIDDEDFTTDTDISASGKAYTNGLSYEAYNTTYLDILKNA